MSFEFHTNSADREIILKRLQNINNLVPELVIDPVKISYETNHISFDIFGCWNSMDTNSLDKTASYKGSRTLPLVANMMQKYQNQFNPSFMIGVGDNFYASVNPDVIKNIDTGFNILATQNIPYFVSLGNHDIESSQVLYYQLQKSYKDLRITNNTVNFGKWVFPGANYLLEIKTQENLRVFFIMIDTNLFIKSKTELNYLQDPERKIILQKILSWIESVLNEISKEGIVFVTGHHPFFAYGHKHKRLLIKNPEFDELYKLLIKYRIKFYLCADEHNFQHIYDSDHDFHQIISGGASFGDETFSMDRKTEPFDSKGIKLDIPNMNLYCKMLINSPHFVNFTITADQISMNVVTLSDNQNHSYDYLKENCKDKITNNFNYIIAYSYSIPKYHDYIYINNCKEYLNNIEKELEAVSKKIGQSGGHLKLFKFKI